MIGKRRMADLTTGLLVLCAVCVTHYPSPRHEFALAATRASECAAAEGKFESMHDGLFSYQDSLGKAPWWWFAKAAGVRDSLRFDSCMAETGHIAALAKDTVAGRQLQVRGTPTLLVHDIRLNGIPSFDSLLADVDRAEKASTLTKSR